MSDPNHSVLDEEALDWLVRVSFGTARPAEFAAWRARSPAHETAARAAETLWREIGQTETAAAFARREAVRGPVARLPQRPGRRPVMGRRAALGGALAASAAALVAGSGVLGPLAGLTADYATRPGERRAVALPDGSTVLLNTATALSVDFGDGERRIALKAGEAFFEVAKDPDRPFLVVARAGETRAVGTAFAVRADGDAVQVTVSEGIVEVTAASGEPMRLLAGQGVSYGGDGRDPASRPHAVNEAAATAWRRGKLIFNQRPLVEVAAEMSRYRSGRVMVANPDLERLPVTGVFELDDQDGTLRAIEQALPVKVLHLPLLTLLR
ncbi:transmembrane sensor [Azospirillum agricola]|uniref:FecR family protein n=1 Tax=Azospirillum agricola TaxID=1720247 RepID=UPI001AE3F696|nr:FecR domain-containing protein [Azospirillum agricola]MBP2231638.1 transmembrane sensor [Azospirillum agricola]